MRSLSVAIGCLLLFLGQAASVHFLPGAYAFDSNAPYLAYAYPYPNGNSVINYTATLNFSLVRSFSSVGPT